MNTMMRLIFMFGLIATCSTFNQVLAQRKVEQIDPEKKEEEQKQKEEKERSKATEEKFTDKLSFGGNIALWFGNTGGFFAAQPTVFYRFNEETMFGTGVTYYYWERTFALSGNRTQKVSDNAYGLNLFARRQLFEPLFLQAEYMPMNTSVYNFQTNELSRQWVGSFLLGGGINQPISERSGYYIVLLYDVLWDENRSFMPSPIDIRTGFYF